MTIKTILQNEYPEVYNEILDIIDNLKKTKKVNYMRQYRQQKNKCHICNKEYNKGQYIRHAKIQEHLNSVDEETN